jgi:anti-anti-sigma factor
MAIEQEDSQLRISRSHETGWLLISGEIDAWNVGAVRQALQELVLEAGDVDIDVSRLLFCDVTGIRAIVSAAAHLESGRRLNLHGLHPQLQKVFKVVGWGDMQSLVLDANGVHR